MLQSIRDKTSGWIAYLIIGLISIPFALWGINSYLGGGQEQFAAVVDGDEISARQLDFAYGRYRERLKQVFGGTLPAAFDNEITLKEQVLTQIIEEQVLINYINDKGYRVGDQKLFDAIRTMSAFQKDGQFDKELYRKQLASQGYVPAQFEQELRRTSAMGQLNTAVRATAFTVPARTDAYQELKNQQRKLRLLTIENKTASIDVSDQEVEDYYNNNPDKYRTPAKVKVDYIEVSLDKVKSGISVDEDRVMERYEQMKDQLTTAEVRQASHILLTVASDASDEEVEKVKQKIQDLKNQIDSGEDFAELAKAHSQDPGSAAEGGDLGEVERGMMVKPFETALFELEPGQISDPVKTRFGWHIIKLESVSGGKTKSFTEARKQIEQDLKTELAETRIYDLVENLSNIGYEQPDSLLPASEHLGLKIETTDWFTRSRGQGVADSEKFRQAAFSDDVLNKNRNSETIELSPNRVVLMHLNAHEESKIQPLHEVRNSVVESVKRQKGREQALTRGKELLADVKAGKTLDDVAEKAGLDVIDSGFVGRSSAGVDRDVLNVAFTLPRPGDNPVFEGVAEVDGDYTIVEVAEIKVNTNAEDSKPEELSEALSVASADYDYKAMIQSLTESASVTRTPVSELVK